MNPSNINSLNSSQWLYAQMNAIAGEIEASPMSPQKYALLTRRLDSAFEALQSMESKTTHLFIKTQTECLKEQFRDLYHQLDNALVNREIAQIQDASNELLGGPSLPAIKKLETHLKSLMHKYAPSVEHHKVLSDARRAIEEAKVKLNIQVSPKPQPKAAQQAAHCADPMDLLPGEVEDLFEIARTIYQGDLKRAKIGFAQLPAEHKQRVQAHMGALQADLFNNPTASMQALIATANELVGNHQNYFTVDEIDEFFAGLAQLNAEESKIFSFGA